MKFPNISYILFILTAETELHRQNLQTFLMVSLFKTGLVWKNSIVSCGKQNQFRNQAWTKRTLILCAFLLHTSVCYISYRNCLGKTVIDP